MTDELQLAGACEEPLDQVIPIHLLRTPSRRKPGVAVMALPLGPRRAERACEGPGCVLPGGVGTLSDSFRTQGLQRPCSFIFKGAALMEFYSIY